jgi:integrase
MHLASTDDGVSNSQLKDGGITADSLKKPLASSARGTYMAIRANTLAALRERYRQELDSQPISKSNRKQKLMLFDRIGDPRTATKADVVRVLEPFKGATRRQYLSSIRSMFHDLALLGLIQADPSVGVRMNKPTRYEPRPVSEDELQSILAIGGRIREWAVLGAYAGLRRFEVLQVERDHLLTDERGPTILVPNGKGGTKLTVPAHPLVVEVLLAHGPGRLWPITVATFDDVWRRNMSKHGLDGCTFHRLRHRFATSVYQATGDLLTTAKVCRHQSVATTQVYARVADKRPYDAVMAI